METFLLCPGQGAQSIGMGRVWNETNATVRETLSDADQILGDQLGQPLTKLCFLWWWQWQPKTKLFVSPAD